MEVAITIFQELVFHCKSMHTFICQKLVI